MVYGHTLCVYVYRPTPLINLRERRRWGWEWRKWKRTRNGHDETDRRTDERMDGWAKRTKKQARFEGGQGRLTEAEGGGVEEWRGAAPKLRDYVLSITARTHIHPPQHPQIPPPPNPNCVVNSFSASGAKRGQTNSHMSLGRFLPCAGRSFRGHASPVCSLCSLRISRLRLVASERDARGFLRVHAPIWVALWPVTWESGGFFGRLNIAQSDEFVWFVAFNFSRLA